MRGPHRPLNAQLLGNRQPRLPARFIGSGGPGSLIRPGPVLVASGQLAFYWSGRPGLPGIFNETRPGFGCKRAARFIGSGGPGCPGSLIRPGLV